MSRLRKLLLFPSLLVLALVSLHSSALERQPFSAYHARRTALGNLLHGGVAILFAAEEPLLDFMPYRQDADFYYLTGWNQPGAALLIAGPDAANHRPYREILFLPTRNLRMEKYTGIKMDASTPGASAQSGIAEVMPMTALPGMLNTLISADRRLAANLWTEPGEDVGLLPWTAVTLGDASPLRSHDLTQLTMPLRQVKDSGEIALLTHAADASIDAQRLMFRSVHPGATERAVAGEMIARMMENGCERPSYAPIVGSGIHSTTLHYAENSGTMQAGDVVVVDAACEYSMYASDITRTVPVSGHFTERQREVYDVVLGAQRAAAAAFVAGKSTINDPYHKDPNSLDSVAWQYIHDHGKGPHGEPLSDYWIHGLGHMVGIDVHDPANYPAVLKPGMVFTIEPGVYIPEEKLGVRIEDTFVVSPDGKLIDLIAKLPHTAEHVEAAMKATR